MQSCPVSFQAARQKGNSPARYIFRFPCSRCSARIPYGLLPHKDVLPAGNKWNRSYNGACAENPFQRTTRRNGNTADKQTACRPSFPSATRPRHDKLSAYGWPPMIFLLRVTPCHTPRLAGNVPPPAHDETAGWYYPHTLSAGTTPAR